MTQRGLRGPIPLVIAGLVLAVFAFGFAPSIWETYRYKPRVDPLADFRAALGEGIASVQLKSTCVCKPRWNVSLDSPQISQFTEADSAGISGHSYPIYEAQVYLSTKSQTQTYNVSVNVHEPSDLFLRRVVVSPDGSGSPHEWVYTEFRLPHLGKWVQELAPQGAL